MGGRGRGGYAAPGGQCQQRRLIFTAFYGNFEFGENTSAHRGLCISLWPSGSFPIDNDSPCARIPAFANLRIQISWLLLRSRQLSQRRILQHSGSEDAARFAISMNCRATFCSSSLPTGFPL